MSKPTVLDEILMDEKMDPIKPKTFLDLMGDRRQAFWDSKPENEKSHFQGYENVSPQTQLMAIKRQAYAEIVAMRGPEESMAVCPWQDIRLDLARQIHEEGRHFNLVKNHLEAQGGNWENDWAPDFPEHQELFGGMLINVDYRFFLDGAEENVARCSALNFGVEGWDTLYVVPNFIPKIEKTDPDLAEIFDDVIIPDEHFHMQIGEKVLGRYCTTHRLQKLAIHYLDRSMELLHKVNYKFPDYINKLESVYNEKTDHDPLSKYNI